jgi:hypothetical protein
MAWRTLDNKHKILQIINYLIFERTEIKISIKEEKSLFSSRFIKLDQEDPLSNTEETPQMIIDKLFPEKGNTLIQSVPHVTVGFIIKGNICRCSLKYIGISGFPYIGFIVSFPDRIQIAEKRKEERITYETPEFVSVEFRLGKDVKKDKLYELNVLDYSEHGLGLLITQKDFDLLELLHKGDKIEDISFFASWTMIKVSGTVKHITKIEDGKHKGCYILGIGSPDIIESCKPMKVREPGTNPIFHSMS